VEGLPLIGPPAVEIADQIVPWLFSVNQKKCGKPQKKMLLLPKF
jgi:hypothetical protein